jgi:hypothetical protein
MSFLDKPNRRIAARVHGSRPQLIVEGPQLALLAANGERETFRLSELTQATLSHRDMYAGDAVVLRLGFSDGRQVAVSQDDPQWFELTAALDQSGMIPVQSAEWQLEFLAAGDGGPTVSLMALRRT